MTSPAATRPTSLGDLMITSLQLGGLYQRPFVAAPPLTINTGGGAIISPFLRGINYSGQESGGSVFAFPFAHALQYFIDKGVDVFRLTFSMERICPTPGGNLDATYTGHLADTVTYLTSRGCRVILDAHNFGHFKVGATIDDNSITGGTDVLIGKTGSYTSAHFIDFWTKVDASFRHPLVIHSIQNEPDVNIGAATYYAMAQAWITALRNAGYRGLLLINGVGAGAWYWQAVDTYGNRANSVLLTDPIRNWAIDIHHYPDANAQGISTTVIPEFLDKLSDFTTFCRSVGLKAFLGEVGAGRDATNLAALSTMIAHVEANADVYVGWADWTAVQYQDSTYLNLLPTELASSDAAGPYTDRPQMGVLAPYFTAAAAAPSFVADPVVSGSASLGTTLTATRGGATGFPAPTVAHQWYRDGAAISGATSASYTSVTADVGHSITYKATATNASGSATSSASNAVGPIVAFQWSELGSLLEAHHAPADASPSAWNDTSGNNHHFTQATGANQPTQITGGLRFDNTSKRMLSNLSASDTDQTIYAVIQIGATSSGSRTILGAATGDGALGGSGRQFFINSSGQGALNSQGSASLAAAAGLATSRKCIVRLRMNPTTGCYFAYDGGADVTAGGFHNNASFTAGRTTALGAKESGGESLFNATAGNADVFEIVVLNANPTQTQEDRIVGRLAWDHAINSFLPPAHPFYNASP